MSRATIFCSLLVILCIPLRAQEIILSDGLGITDISSRVSILEDPSCSLDFYSVVKRNDFTPGKGLPNMGVSKSCFWIRVDLTNRSSEDHFQFILEHPILDFVELYDSTGLVESIVESGNYFNRNFDDPNYVFDITLPPDSKTSYYLKTGGSELIVIPLSIGKIGRAHV